MGSENVTEHWFGLEPTVEDAWGARLIASEVEEGLPGCVPGRVSEKGTPPSVETRKEALRRVGEAIRRCIDEGWDALTGWTLRWRRPYSPGGYVYVVLEGPCAALPEGEPLTTLIVRLEAEEREAEKRWAELEASGACEYDDECGVCEVCGAELDDDGECPDCGECEECGEELDCGLCPNCDAEED